MNTFQDSRAFLAPASALILTRQSQMAVPMSPSVASNARALRILVPINANDDSRRGVDYALHQHQGGRPVEVILLNIGEPVDQWEILRYRTQLDVAQFHLERAQAFIEEAMQPLAAADIPCRGLFKQGKVVFAILDTAEEYACDEIAMPEPNKGLGGLFSRGIVKAVMRRQRGIPVVTLAANGVPARITAV